VRKKGVENNTLMDIIISVIAISFGTIVGYAVNKDDSA
jgi:hypothetical protein